MSFNKYAEVAEKNNQNAQQQLFQVNQTNFEYVSAGEAKDSASIPKTQNEYYYNNTALGGTIRTTEMDPVGEKLIAETECAQCKAEKEKGNKKKKGVIAKIGDTFHNAFEKTKDFFFPNLKENKHYTHTEHSEKPTS